MKIAFIGDLKSQNTISWIEGLKAQGNIEIHTWSLEDVEERKSKLFRALKFFRGFIALKKWLKNINPDLLIGYRTTSYGFLAALTGFKPTVIALQGETDLWPNDPITLPIKKQLKRYAVKKAAMIHAWGENMVPSLLEHKANREQILVLPRGIDIDKFILKERNFYDETIKLIVTRSLYPEYHHETIINAVNILNNKKINTELIVAGSGNETFTNSLKEKVEKLSLKDKINFVGKIPADKLQEYLSNSHFYVSTPETEGTSASLFEAMANGCIPIVSDLAANQCWIKHKQNGGLVPYMDSQKLAETIEEMYLEKEKLNNILLNNRRLVEEKASLNNNMKLFIENYKKLIEK